VAVDGTLAGRSCLNFETGLASPERGLVPVAFSSTLLRDSQGKKIGALLSIQDLSEIRRNFLPWRRPEGAYPGRDGKYLIVIPTIPLRDQLGTAAR